MAQINNMWVEERQQWIKLFEVRARTVAPLLPGCKCGGKWAAVEGNVEGSSITASVVTTHGRLSVQVPVLHCVACPKRQKISPVYLGCFPMNTTAMSPHSDEVCSQVLTSVCTKLARAVADDLILLLTLVEHFPFEPPLQLFVFFESIFAWTRLFWRRCTIMVQNGPSLGSPMGCRIAYRKLLCILHFWKSMDRFALTENLKRKLDLKGGS